MKLRIRRSMAALLLLTGVTLFAMQQSQTGGSGSGRGGKRGGAAAEEEDVIMPNGKRQKDEILKADHEQNVKDAAELAELAQQLKLDLEKNDRFILSMSTLKKTDDIEKLVKRIRARMRHN